MKAITDILTNKNFSMLMLLSHLCTLFIFLDHFFFIMVVTGACWFISEIKQEKNPLEQNHCQKAFQFQMSMAVYSFLYEIGRTILARGGWSYWPIAILMCWYWLMVIFISLPMPVLSFIEYTESKPCERYYFSIVRWLWDKYLKKMPPQPSPAPTPAP